MEHALFLTPLLVFGHGGGLFFLAIMGLLLLVSALHKTNGFMKVGQGRVFCTVPFSMYRSAVLSLRTFTAMDQLDLLHHSDKDCI